MSLFSSPSRRQSDIALAVLRIAVGAIFIAHGSQKLFTMGFGGVTGMFGHMGIPLAPVMGPVVALIEFFGGIALVLGLITRLAAFALACDMLGAMIFVHFKAGFFLPAGYEFPLSLFAANIALIFAGAGSFSIDGFLANRGARGAGSVSSPRPA